MATASQPLSADFRPGSRKTGAAGILLGLGFTLVIFLAISHLERTTSVAPPPEVADLRAVAVSEPPPPPPEVLTREQAPAPEMLTGFEAVASESPVKLALPIPDLDALAPPPQVAPSATIEVGRLYTDLRPKFDEAGFKDRIYQTADVDQVPKPLRRVVPLISSAIQRRTETSRTTVLFVVDMAGAVRNVRVVKSSGDDEFDTLVADAIKEWTFSPAVRRGKKVQCLVQQVTIIKLSGGALFSL